MIYLTFEDLIVGEQDVLILHQGGVAVQAEDSLGGRQVDVVAHQTLLHRQVDHNVADHLTMLNGHLQQRRGDFVSKRNIVLCMVVMMFLISQQQGR